MKHLKYLFLLVVVSCASPNIIYDYDTKLDLNQYKTFNFFSDVGEGMNKFDIERITNAIKFNLEKQEIRQVEKPDFFVNVISKVHRQSRPNSSVGVSVGGGNGGFGYGISTGIPIESRKIFQQITIDFVDGKNNNLIWQSVVDSEIKEKLSPEERTAYYQKIIEKVIAGFPPKKK